MARHAAHDLLSSGYGRSAPRRPVNLSLDEDLPARARSVTRNLPGTVEDLLAPCVRDDQARRRDEAIAAVNAVHDEHGVLSDEFSSL